MIVFQLDAPFNDESITRQANVEFIYGQDH